MKKIIVSLSLLIGLASLLLVGCTGRQVTKVIETPTHDLATKEMTLRDEANETDLINPIEQEETDKRPEGDSIKQYESKENEDTSDSLKVEVPEEAEEGDDSQTDDGIEDKEEGVIVAKSENLEEIDERALMLKELDVLLEDVLAKLDAVEEDDLSDDNLFDEGGD